MSSSSYEIALACLLGHEGGYSNHSSDPGGPTNYGITIYDYRKYVKADATAAEVKAMKVDEAKAIFRVKYWDAQRCDELPAGVDYAVFDYGVNSGIGRSGKVLRRCLDLPDSSSSVNDAVVACAIHADPKALVTAICDERLRFLKGLGTWPVFGKGWGRRVAEVKALALQLATKQPAATPEPAPDVLKSGKAMVPLAKGAQQGSAVTIAAAGAAALQQAHESGAGSGTVTLIVALTIAGAIAGFMFWRWRQRHQQAAAA